MLKNLLLSIFLLSSFISHGKGLVVMGDSFPPFSYLEHGQKKGMAFEIVNKVLEDSGVEVERNIIGNWKNVYSYALENSHSLIYTIVKNKERLNKFHWIGPLSDRAMYFYALKSRKDIVINSWKDISKYKSISLEKATITDYVKGKGASIQYAKNLSQAYNMFVRERADLLVMLDYSFSFLDKDKHTSKQVWKIDQPGEYYMAIHIDTPSHIVQKIRKSFENLQKSGFVKKVQEGYR
jgi:polar amino acid transport system substrate-binding protein